MLNVAPALAIATVDKPLADRRMISLSVNGSESLDLLTAQRMQRFGQLRAVFIDTSEQDSSGNGLTLQTDLGQTIKAAPGTQGYYPVFCPFVTKLSFSCNEICNVQLYDFSVSPAVWKQSNDSGSARHVIIDDQPIATNATIQNWPTKTNEGLGLGFTFIAANGSFTVGIGPGAIPVNAITAINIFGINYTNTAGPQIELFLGALQIPGRIAVPFSATAISGLLIDLNGLNLNVGSVQSTITATVAAGGTYGGQLLLQVAYR